MNILLNPKAAAFGTGAHACGRALAALFLTLVCGAVCIGAQVGRPDAAGRAFQQQQQSARKDEPAEADDDESESQPTPFTRPSVVDPATILRRARFVLVRSDSVFVSGREVEDSLRKRKEFRAWGMVVTRDESEADLVIEITRKSFTRRFTFSVLDPRTSEVVASGKTRSVIFGKKIANKVAEKFANRVKVYRPYPPNP
ncbi:MAG TPA: hypothetical protein VJ866_17710 [Pyrinomonadaceae bacterium]|nr:hypothetical protein [Pyrinomonadaceae bacterium]